VAVLCCPDSDVSVPGIGISDALRLVTEGVTIARAQDTDTGDIPGCTIM
jgi:hypothetical protein